MSKRQKAGQQLFAAIDQKRNQTSRARFLQVALKVTVTVAAAADDYKKVTVAKNDLKRLFAGENTK
jgi:hypothetical protein